MSTQIIQNKKSSVWLHFNLIEATNKAKCKVCGNLFSYKGSAISNLRKHLRVKHAIVCKETLESGRKRIVGIDDELEQSDKSPAISIFYASPSSSTASATGRQHSQQEQEPTPSTSDTNTANVVSTHIRKKSRTQATLHLYSKGPLSVSQQQYYNNLVMNLIIKDLQPFSIVEDEGFIELIAGFNSSYKLPSRTTLSRTLLPEKYNLVAEKVKTKLKDATYITLTTDTWTSSATENYMSITAHFINNHWELQSILVDCFKFSENLKTEITKVVTEWEISDKVHTIVTDNAYNITNAVKLTEWTHLPCLAHTLNLIVQGALKQIEHIRTKVRRIVEYFHKSTVAAEKLKSLQAQMNENSNTLKLINEVQTRWNSYDMFERISTIQESVEAALGVLHNPIDEPISADEWNTLKEICRLLKPFKQISTELSADKVLTSCKIIPMIEGLKTCLERVAVVQGSDIVIDLKNALLDGIKTRFPRFEYNRILAHSTYLDPRFKKEAFSDPSALDKLKGIISSEIAGLIQSSHLDETEESNTVTSVLSPSTDGDENTIWQDFDKKILTVKRTPLSDSIIELRRYKMFYNGGKAEN